MSTRNLETIQRFWEAHNRGDLDALAELFAPDAVTIDRARGLTFHGRQGIKTFKGDLRRAFPDLVGVSQHTIDAGDTVIVQEQATGTHQGPLGPLGPTGNAMSLLVCAVFQFGTDGLVSSADFYWDQLTLLQQLGAVPVPSA
jgi:steroid delta-isomerase-like uncharacterized protein